MNGAHEKVDERFKQMKGGVSVRPNINIIPLLYNSFMCVTKR